MPTGRRVLAAVLACVQWYAAVGSPRPGAPAERKEAGGAAYPCQARPCGCVTAAACWAGDCCCFSLAEKLAWADDSGVAVPGHVRPLVAARRAAATPKPAKSCRAKSCCESPPAAPARVAWAAEAAARKCKGLGPHGLTVPDPCVLPAAGGAAEEDGAGEVVAIAAEHIISRPVRPPTRPPRGA